MADGIIGTPRIRNLTFFGQVTQIISATQFVCATLAGEGDNFFQDWDIYVVRKGTGTGVAPQGDRSSCSAYTNLGVFTHGGFDTTALVIGDSVYLMHPFLGNNTNMVDFPSNDLKESSPDVATTSALVYTKVKELAFTGKVGGARIKFDLKVDNAAGHADAVVYKNGLPITTNPTAVPIYTEWTNATAVYQTFTQDISGLVVGDLIQIYSRVNAAPRIASVKNFNIYYDLVHLPSVQTAIESIYFDAVNGFPGTEPSKGTASQPSNNVADVLTMLANRNLSKITLAHGVFTLPSNLSGIHFVGNNFSDPGALFNDNVIELAGFTLSKCAFDGINIDNNSTGISDAGSLSYCGHFVNCTIYADVIANCHNFVKCNVNALTLMETCDDFTDCSINATVLMSGCANFQGCSSISAGALSSCFNFFNCQVAPFNAAVCNTFINCVFGCLGTVSECFNFIDCGLDEDLILSMPIFPGTGMFNFKGAALTITDLTDPAAILNVSGDFTLTIDATCVGGTINVYGNVRLIDNSFGATVNDYTIWGAVGGVVADLAVPVADVLDNVLERDVIGNKTDTTDIVIGNTSSLMRYMKGNLAQINALIATIGTPPVLTETSGTLTADGTEQNVVINNAPAAVFKPLEVKLDLSNMAAGDITVVRVYERITAAGGLILEDTVTYSDDVSPDMIVIDLQENRYGFKVTLEQTDGAGHYRDFDWEYIYEA